MKIKYGQLITLILMFFIAGCSVKQPPVGKKVIPNEDEYIIKALMFEDENNLTAAVDTYKFLYDKTKKPVYYEKMIEDLFYQKKYKEVIELSSEYLEKKFDKQIFMYKILSLLEIKQINKAKEELLSKLNKKDEFFYRMMAFIYLKEKNYKKAADYLKSLYALNHNKETLLQLVDILIKIKKYNEALAYLRTHLDMYGCEFDICLRLAIIYKQTYDYDSLANIYEKMGKFDQKYLMFALRIYLDNEEYEKALKLIDKNNLGDEYKLIVYETKKDYKKAAFYAYKLYEKTAKLPYLLKYCTYKYEANPSKTTAKEIIPKLKYLLKFYPSAYLYNFLGYIMIDNDIDVKEGLKYVQKAVEMKPDNEEYIDSLAWGYYKLGKCKEAWDIIKYIKLKDKEILMHKEKIKKCIKKNKKEKKIVKNKNKSKGNK
ncbi:tetratricopeptide repeat protein [Nautilia lithotrophica]